MKKEFSSKKSGFSLIELAIVLIIIGLLIAGVTGGASLIKSAELRAVVTEARSNSISASAFFSLYDSLPGDSATYTAATVVGDGDGRIEFCRTGTCGAITSLSEGGGVLWSQLTKAGVVNIPGFTAVASNAAQSLGATPSMMPSKTKGSGWVFDFNAVSTRNFSILIPTGIASADLETATTYAIFAPSDVFAIDAKNDDGKPGTGTIKAAGSTTGCVSTAITDSASATAATYVSASTGKACTIMFDLDATTGN